MSSPYPVECFQLEAKEVTKLIQLALEEDKIIQDISTQGAFNAKETGTARILAKESGIVCGIPIVEKTFLMAANLLQVENVSSSFFFQDGDQIKAGDSLWEGQGSIYLLLGTERIVLNFLSLLSGVATKTNRIVKKLKPHHIQLLDTRKTIPGYRHLLKYAVSTGGGLNHRLNLSDMGMIKDNHIAQAGSIEKAIQQFKQKFPEKPFEVEVDTLQQLQEAIKAGANHILLDNMDKDTLKQAVHITKELANNKKITLEASGGLDEHNLDKVIGTGVDFVSIGKLTSAIAPIDFSMEVKKQM